MGLVTLPPRPTDVYLIPPELPAVPATLHALRFGRLASVLLIPLPLCIDRPRHCVDG